MWSAVYALFTVFMDDTLREGEEDADEVSEFDSDDKDYKFYKRNIEATQSRIGWAWLSLRSLHHPVRGTLPNVCFPENEAANVAPQRKYMVVIGFMV